ncbi:hypothetical protein FKM82_027273, partial [Ascaphus truei]
RLDSPLCCSMKMMPLIAWPLKTWRHQPPTYRTNVKGRTPKFPPLPQERRAARNEGRAWITLVTRLQITPVTRTANHAFYTGCKSSLLHRLQITPVTRDCKSRLLH